VHFKIYFQFLKNLFENKEKCQNVKHNINLVLIDERGFSEDEEEEEIDEDYESYKEDKKKENLTITLGI
jgi:hypothetical protein